MELRKSKSPNAITLIALVITIIVLLILGGVALNLVLGEDGIVARTIKSRDVHNIAVIEEKANLAYHNLLIGGYVQDGVYHQVNLGTVLAQLVADGDITSAIPAGGTSITGFTLSENSVELGIGDSATVSAVPTIGEENGNYEVVIDGQTYLAHIKNGSIVIDKDTVTSSESSFEISNVSTSNATVTAEKTSATEVTVTANSTGTSIITVSYGSIDETFTVAVVTKYAVNLYASSTAETATAITVVEGTKASDATGYTLPEAPSGQVFDKWLLKTAVTGYSAGADATSLLNNVTQNLNVYATFKTPAWADLHPANPAYVADFGKIVSGYTPTGGGTWRLFYADSSDAYLIRDSIGNIALNNSSMTGFGGDMTSSEFTLVGRELNPKYTKWELKNNGTDINNNIKAVASLLDTREESRWNIYKTGSANWAIGAPSLEMFIASYNATHTAEAITAYKASKQEYANETLMQVKLECTVGNLATLTGYQVMKAGDGGFNSYTANLGNSSTLDKAIYCANSGYWWLATPSSGGNNSVFLVNNYNVGSLGSDSYTLTNIAVRPLVSIPLSNIGTGAGKIEIEDF